MKALVLKEKGKIEYIDKSEPTLEALHGALLEPVLVSPCTSDVHTIWQGSPKRPDLTLGHEVIAKVKAIGSEVKDFKPGDLVAVSAITPDWSQPDVDINYAHAGQNFSAHMIGKSIDGAFQSTFYLPFADKNLARIPEGMSLEDALMCVDVVQTGFTAVEEAAVSEGDTVVVMGIGAIGLAAIMGSKLAGAKKIYAVGSRPDNVKIAESMSDETCKVEVLNYKTLECPLPEGMHPLANSTGSPVVNYVLQQTATKGADKVLICGGNDYSLPQAIDMVKYGTGIVSNVMYFGADTEVQDEECRNLSNINDRFKENCSCTSQQSNTGAPQTNIGTLQSDNGAIQSNSGTQQSNTGTHQTKPESKLNTTIDSLQIPKFSMGRGMAGKTLKFSLSKGGRENLERVISLIKEHDLHPGVLITERYEGLDKVEQAIYDMKDRKAIKIAIRL
ncbi:Threonine dehydrogenase [Oribacterium sp. KHPX15]|uniref:alcohol dehydrogenase catalytic domain-containing protein n=1 Tax=Oribacterium sp. KHPX15 TaxID=1855342 RepID=UPI00089727B9|nr:alcohol dehydrogenase catalytic domain-containing protein [Oribacterium sp. KHPX15]SEA57212.1 Threonine dehydrogenase [Oribacterium sp. KHPX15]